MSKSIVAISFGLLALLAACDQTEPSQLGGTANPDVRDQRAFEDLVGSLLPEDRENVVYVRQDGKVFSTKPELLQELDIYKVRDGNTAINAQGQTLQIPAFQPRPLSSDLSAQVVTPACRPSDGPFHRVNSKNGTLGTPYSRINAYITLPPPTSIVLKTYSNTNLNEAAYAYLGGWGNGTAGNSSAVDAGFVYSPVTQNWSQVIFVEGASAYVQLVPGETVPPRLSSGTIPADFYVPQDNKVAFATRASFTSGVPQRTLVADAPTWRADGVGNIVKYNVSMTQPNGVDFRNGSSYTGVEFKDISVGTTAAVRLWASSDTQIYTQDAAGNTVNKGACDYPNDSTRILVNPISPSNQRVTIKLNP